MREADTPCLAATYAAIPGTHQARHRRAVHDRTAAPLEHRGTSWRMHDHPAQNRRRWCAPTSGAHLVDRRRRTLHAGVLNARSRPPSLAHRGPHHRHHGRVVGHVGRCEHRPPARSVIPARPSRRARRRRRRRPPPHPRRPARWRRPADAGGGARHDRDLARQVVHPRPSPIGLSPRRHDPGSKATIGTFGRERRLRVPELRSSSAALDPRSAVDRAPGRGRRAVPVAAGAVGRERVRFSAPMRCGAMTACGPPPTSTRAGRAAAPWSAGRFA